MFKQLNRSPFRGLTYACLALTLVGCGDDGSGGSGTETSAETNLDDTGVTVGPNVTSTDGMTGTSASSVDSTTDNPTAGSDDTTTAPPELDDFSFFLTSLAGLQKLSGSELGFGGNLSYDGEIGLAGADRICQTLAEASMPGSAVKEWRAFLSTSTGDAIDRIGEGPWYDRNGRLVAEDLAGLMSERPSGDPALADDLPNEWGVPNSSPDGKFLDNHDTMTASGEDGRLILKGTGMGGGPPGSGGDFSTCEDWTSAAPGQDPPAMGHSWPSMSGMHWIFVGRHGNGCEPFVWLEQTGANCDGGSGVGCGGGYGGFYCFALNP